MKNMRIVAALLGTLLVSSGYFPSADGPASVATAAPELTDLRGVDELRSLFNNDAGKVRLVLLLSPT
jgi:hypothetical protein